MEQGSRRGISGVLAFKPLSSWFEEKKLRKRKMFAAIDNALDRVLRIDPPEPLPFVSPLTADTPAPTSARTKPATTQSPRPIVPPHPAIRTFLAGDALPEQLQHGRLPLAVLVTDEARTEGTFLLHHFVGRCLRRRLAAAGEARTSVGSVGKVKAGAAEEVESGAVLVCLRNPVDGFDTVAKKLGYSPRTSRLFRHVDGFSHLHDFSGPFSPSTFPASESLASRHADTKGPTLSRLHGLYLAIVERMESLREKDGPERPCLVVVDDLTCLVDVGFGAEDVYRFYMALREHVFDTCGTLVVLAHKDKTTILDKEHDWLCSMVLMSSDCWMSVTGLESGYTDSVTGQVVINRGPHLVDLEFKPVHLLYHVAETGIKFFAPGHV
ncbi:Elongator subunit elp6 [Phlyctochytrium bullatum]|nr:Elongator subunit elp6 [Phlyctochytrium bullatum]